MDEILAPIAKPMAWLLSLFYGLIPNLGIAIILVTFTIMLLLYPLTAKQARSMIAMQMVQPEIKRLQAKYKNDRAKLNEEMMAFYQENKINPLAGCLPLLIQMPIFFALFRVLSHPTKYIPEDSKLYDAFCTTSNGVKATVQQCGNGKGQFKGLPVHQDFLGIDLSVSAPNQIGTWATVAAFAMVLLVMFTGYMQSRQAQKRTPAVNKQMALITKVLPVFFGFISLNFPSGLVLYFFVSNSWRLGQQEVIFRHVGTAANPKHKSLIKPPKNDVVDAESRDRGTTIDVLDDPAELEAGESTPKTTPKPTPKATPKGTTAKSSSNSKSTGNAEAIPVAPPPRGGGGIRSLFRLPPPPGEAPMPAPPTAKSKSVPAAKPSSSTSRSGSSSSAGPRPGQAGRRTSKKKKKR